MPHLKIDCTNLRTQTGQLIAVVWDKAEHFRSEDSAVAVRTIKADVATQAMTLDVGDLPAGQYAVSIVHDENANDRLDVTPHLQLPKEGAAFSNNPRMGLKGPEWSSCVFDHSADSTIAIALKYWR